MTQVIPGPAAPPAPSRPAVTRAPSPLDAVRQVFDGTPGRMRALATAAVFASLVLALGGGWALMARSDALDTARAGAEQVARIAEIRTSLVQADADASNAFLVGGLESAEQRTDYQDSLAQATSTIVAAAAAEPADAESLGKVNAAVARYAGLVETARANNRVGNPVGAQYLRVASASLVADAVTPLRALGEANNDRVDAAYGAGNTAVWYLVAAGLIGLAALAAVQLWLSTATRRILNLPLVAGSIAVIAALVLGGSALASSASRAQKAYDGPFSATVALAGARTSAFDAKSKESLALINRGTGKTAAGQSATSEAEAEGWLGIAEKHGVGGGPKQSLVAWNKVRQSVRALDDAGKWDEAVKLATDATSTSGTTSNAAFKPFATQSATDLAAQSSRTTSELSASRTLLLTAGIALLLAGILAAALAWWGVSQRLEEYR